MSKKIRLVTKKRKLNMTGILCSLWIILFSTYLASHVFLTAYNTELAVRVQKNDELIAEINESINATSLSVKELSTRERILSIVTAQGLKSNPDNVVSVHTP